MHRISFVAAVFVVGLWGCGAAQPTTYRTAISSLPTTALPASCYTGGNLPTTTTTATNQDSVADWTLWTGTSLQYLSPDFAFDFVLGDSPEIKFNNVTIEGGPTVFTETQVTTSPTTTTTQTVTVTFSATPGDTATGTIDAKSDVAPTGGTPSCEGTFSFVGRKVF